MHYDWNFERLGPYFDAFVAGTLTTLSLTAAVILFGTILGILLGVSLTRHSTKLLLYPLLDVVRAVPPLVLIMFAYYSLTLNVIGYAVPAYWVYVISMSINLAAFTADFVRSAIESIGTKITESGLSLGMSNQQVRRHLFVPHVIRALIPAMTSLYIAMLKMSSLASVISVAELVYVAQSISVHISRSLEAWIVVAAIYIVIVLPLAAALREVERRFQARTKNLERAL